MTSKDPDRLRILVTRPDRVGDVILSTPVFEVLKKHYPSSRITALVQKAVAPLIEGLPSVDEVMIFDPAGKHAGMSGLFELITEFRQRDFRIGVALQSHWKIAAAMFSAGVRYRVGPMSKPHSYLFYNRGVRQRRSEVEMHEADYNLQLLRRLGVRAATRSVPTQVHLADAARSQAFHWLASQGWKAEEGRSLIAVHPGMGGSALNWPESHYLELIRGLLREGHGVLITGGPTEGELLDRIRREIAQPASADPGPPQRAFFYGGPEVGSIDLLAGVLSLADVVVAPSTGPLHLAVALGKPVVSFFPPIRVQSAIRWGPYQPDETRASILVPEVYCGQDFRCRGPVCNYYPCMKGLGVTQALEQVHLQLASSKVRPTEPSP